MNHLVLAALLLSLFFVKWEETIIKTSLNGDLLNKLYNSVISNVSIMGKTFWKYSD